MGRLSTFARDAALAGLTTTITHASLHTGDPGLTGANETSGSGYARLATAAGWLISLGRATRVASLAFSAPAGTFNFLGFWSAASGGTFYGYGAIVASGSHEPKFCLIDCVENTARSRVQPVLDQSVRFAPVRDLYSPTLPAPASTTYYARSLARAIATAPGGSALDLVTNASEAVCADRIGRTLASPGTLTIAGVVISLEF